MTGSLPSAPKPLRPFLGSVGIVEPVFLNERDQFVLDHRTQPFPVSVRCGAVKETVADCETFPEGGIISNHLVELPHYFDEGV